MAMAGLWNAEENLLFEQGLEKFGRDWPAIADHMGSKRTSDAVKKHASVGSRRNFIRLCERTRLFIHFSFL